MLESIEAAILCGSLDKGKSKNLAWFSAVCLEKVSDGVGRAGTYSNQSEAFPLLVEGSSFLWSPLLLSCVSQDETGCKLLGLGWALGQQSSPGAVVADENTCFFKLEGAIGYRSSIDGFPRELAASSQNLCLCGESLEVNFSGSSGKYTKQSGGFS